MYQCLFSVGNIVAAMYMDKSMLDTEAASVVFSFIAWHIITEVLLIGIKLNEEIFVKYNGT